MENDVTKLSAADLLLLISDWEFYVQEQLQEAPPPFNLNLLNEELINRLVFFDKFQNLE